MTTTTTRPAKATPIAAPASRAVLAAVLAVVITFSAEHPARFGILVLGVYLLLQAALLGAWARRLGRVPRGTALLAARAGVSLVGAVLLLTHPDGGIGLLRPVEALVFLLVGALEVAGGATRAEGPETAGDAVVVGGLQVVVGLMLVILNAEARFAVGVLGAWAVLVAVYLGIAAVNLRMRRRRG